MAKAKERPRRREPGGEIFSICQGFLTRMMNVYPRPVKIEMNATVQTVMRWTREAEQRFAMTGLGTERACHRWQEGGTLCQTCLGVTLFGEAERTYCNLNLRSGRAPYSYVKAAM